MIGPLRYCSHIKHINYVPIVYQNPSIGNVLHGLVNRLNYSQDKKGCCKDVAQTTGKKVEPWPKTEPSSTPWRAECPHEPQPPNYDPYRIKVPDVVVPPLPSSNVKEIPNEDAPEPYKHGFNFQSGSSVQDLFHNSPIVHPDYWKDKPTKRLNEAVKEVLPNLGYHGKNKYKYAFHEPWKPLDRVSLLEEAEKQELENAEDTTIKTDKQGL